MEAQVIVRFAYLTPHSTRPLVQKNRTYFRTILVQGQLAFLSA